MNISQRSILITGCSSGIGAHCAKRLKVDGWRVFVTARKKADIDRLILEGFETFYLDYRDRQSIVDCFDAVIRAGDGRLDALFNNGGYAQAGAVEDVPTDALREQFETLVFGWHELTRLAVAHMRGQGFGRIIQHSSVLGLAPMTMRGAYNAAKYALEGLYTTMWMELEGSDIHLSLIETGPMPSKIAINAVPYVEKYIDVENSVHRAAYKKRIAELKAGGTEDKDGQGAEPVYVQLRRALNDKRPDPHYYVTRITHIAAVLRRILPSGLLYLLLKRFS